MKFIEDINDIRAIQSIMERKIDTLTELVKRSEKVQKEQLELLVAIGELLKAKHQG